MHARLGGLLRLFAGLRVAAGEHGNHAVAHVDLVVQVTALQKVQLAVQFRHHPGVGQVLQHGAVQQGAVETVHDVEAHGVGVGRLVGELHVWPLGPVFLRAIHQLRDHFLQDCTLPHSVHPAQYVDRAVQVPHDMLFPAPERGNLDAPNVIANFFHSTSFSYSFPYKGRLSAEKKQRKDAKFCDFRRNFATVLRFISHINMYKDKNLGAHLCMFAACAAWG